MLSEQDRERAALETTDRAYVDDVLDQSVRVEVTEVTYIPCELTPASAGRVLAHMREVAAQSAFPQRIFEITRPGLRAAMAGGVLIEFISKSHIHRYGAHLDGKEAVAIYGPVGFEVRARSGALIAVVEYCAHPAFGSAPVLAEVTGRVR